MKFENTKRYVDSIYRRQLQCNLTSYDLSIILRPCMNKISQLELQIQELQKQLTEIKNECEVVNA